MSNQQISNYVQYLPRIYHKSSDQTYEDYFLGRFLKAFEQVLTGSAEKKDIVGIESILDNFEQYFNPSQTPPQFLEWLASWVALDLEESVEFYGNNDKEQKEQSPIQILPLDTSRSTINRELISKMVQLYKKRGTTKGLLEYLQFYAGEETTISINEYEETAKVGERRKIGVNTMVGKAKPTFFSVHTMIPIHSRSRLQKKVQLIKKVIENEKPFYTNYLLSVEIPSMRVGVYSKVGKETLLGGMIED
ncbi:phage tail protein [Ruminiclostridium herbifermentans]|uniref:Phage tail protein n=1 Tax=Ruminiclostridium herbifermentans TaxID=2488810 RepID=A0A4U7JG47_9FIRM|nr:phage tail protein [Ruminiclostridium herbifermentans]QNU65801.1 phage tail protein [Ruminiclostridium herbifermentans]